MGLSRFRSSGDGYDGVSISKRGIILMCLVTNKFTVVSHRSTPDLLTQYLLICIFLVTSATVLSCSYKYHKYNKYALVWHQLPQASTRVSRDRDKYFLRSTTESLPLL